MITLCAGRNKKIKIRNLQALANVTERLLTTEQTYFGKGLFKCMPSDIKEIKHCSYTMIMQ